LSYYGARYLAPWLTRWINPDAAGAVDGLNFYVYVGNNPLKYIDPTGLL
jgi:RHS repeat-associated protein